MPDQTGDEIVVLFNQFREDVIDELARIRIEIAAVHRALLSACNGTLDERTLMNYRTDLSRMEGSFVDELRGKFHLPKPK